MLTHDQKVELLQSSPQLSDASGPLLEELASAANEHEYEPGHRLFSKGDPAERCYILADGEIEHPEVSTADARYSVSDKVTDPGQLFGWAAAVEGGPKRLISAVCAAPTRVLEINGQAFRELCEAHPESGTEILQWIRNVYSGHEGGLAGRKGWLSLRHVRRVYNPLGNAVVAVDDCSIEMRPGEFVAIVGPSGCGKSTLLNAIAGFDTVNGGEIYLDGQLLNASGISVEPGPDRAVVFQHGALFPWATVTENLIRGPVVQGRMGEAEAREAARALLARVGLSGLEERFPGSMSSGMCRRVEIARALINDPRVILLDEPFRGLDALAKTIMHDALLEMYSMEQKTIFFITHDLDEAIYLSDRVLVMSSRPGRIKSTIFVDLERPRTNEMLSDARFLELKNQAIDAVHEEAVKAFEAGERELA